MHSVRTLSTSAIAIVALASSVAGAQQASASSRWQGYLGCWTAAAMGESYGSAQFAAPIVCITPTANPDAVELATIAEGKVVATERIDASGVAAALEIKDCAGTKTARWSNDERRVFLQSSMTCNGAASTATSILSMTGRGEWIDVRGVAAGGNQNIRVARYRDVGLPSSVPTEIANALRANVNSVHAARVAAGSPYSLLAVQEAALIADSSIVEAWLLERGERFNVKAEHLVALADAGVPAKVIDAIVAVSNPGQFALARSEGASAPGNDDDVVGRRQTVIMDRYDPWSYGYSRYGYGYGYGNPGYGYGYGGYYGGYGYGYGGPIVIVSPGQGGINQLGQPQVVKGRGYTQNQPGSSSTRTGGERSGSSSSAGTGSSASTSPAPAQQSQPAEQRTAKPRP